MQLSFLRLLPANSCNEGLGPKAMVRRKITSYQLLVITSSYSVTHILSPF